MDMDGRGSEGIVSMAVTARGQGGAGTVLNRSHCDYGLKSEVFLKFISFYFFCCRCCYTARMPREVLYQATGRIKPRDFP